MNPMLTEVQFLKIEHAAQWLCPADRDQFWAAVAEELAGRELGDGLVTRAVAKAFARFYRPMQLSAPRSRAWPPPKVSVLPVPCVGDHSFHENCLFADRFL
jgi:hypothetical protein